MNFIPKELKNKIINHQTLTKKEIDTFFEYIIYKVKIMMTYKEKRDENLSKEYTALSSEILASHNIEASKRKIGNHYFCIIHLNNDDYLLDLCEKEHQYRKLTNETYQLFVADIKEKYHE